MKQIAQGAEAKIYSDGKTLRKERISKTYRIKELDEELRKTRTRREGKLLEKLSSLESGVWSLEINVPKLIKLDDKNMILEMEHIKGEKLATFLDKKNMKKICTEIGKAVAKLHANGVIHGDLTTSNMIWNDKLFLIDFGLSFYSQKVEDFAVELHVLKQALESKHYGFWEKAFKLVEKAYRKNYEKADLVLKRLVSVEARGRYKH